MQVTNFPFPTPPEAPALLAAVHALIAIGALHPSTNALTIVGKVSCVPGSLEVLSYPIIANHSAHIFLLGLEKPP